jgi:hypothetical protein
MSKLYSFLSGIHTKLGQIFPRVQRLGFTPALVGINRYRWCGPFNSLTQPPATNKTDAICEQHDKEYDRIYKDKSLSPYEQKKQIRDADNIFRKEQQKIFNDSNQPISDRIMAKIGDFGIGSKMFFDRLSFEPANEIELNLN